MDKIKEIKKVFTDNLQKQRMKDRKISFLRLVLFFIMIFFFYSLANNVDNYYYQFFLTLSFFSFIFLLFYASSISEKMKFYKNVIMVCVDIEEGKKINEIQEFSDHPYDKDLDILGTNSIFSFLNITQTYYGYNALKHSLLYPILEPETILQKQEAIKELSNDIEWNILFLAKAKEANEREYIDTSFKFYLGNTRKTLLSIAIPIINVLILFIFLFLNISIFSVTILLFPILSYLLVNRLYGRKIKKQYTNANLKANEINIYSLLFKSIEEKKFNAKKNNNLKDKFNDGLIASKSIEKLFKLLNYYENRKIPIVGILLNIFVLWDLQFAYRIENHLKEIKSKFPVWLEMMGEFESLISFSIYAQKNPEFVYPVISLQPGFYDFKNFSHPLLEKNTRVLNDFRVDKNNNISIITGANMTGKSTFLRSIGVNLVLAMNGAPVCADKFTFFPSNIFSSMRTNDSLTDGSSYFNAEIKRLRQLIEKLNREEPQFIILDEILKGTNSIDKLNGSKLFIEKIIKTKAKITGIIATHDIDLTKMVEIYPDNIQNLCFELHQENGELVPDYKLVSGVTQTMNAIRLLKEYKIID